MTTYLSRIHMGEKYKDDRFGLEGYAIAVLFSSEGCVEAMLAHAEGDGDKIEIKKTVINELRLVNPDGSQPVSGGEAEYESELVLNRKYVDVQTGITGHCAIVEFHEDMATRGVLRNTGVNNDNVTVLKYHSIDDFLLRDVDTQEVAKKMTPKKSPVTREVHPQGR